MSFKHHSARLTVLEYYATEKREQERREGGGGRIPYNFTSASFAAIAGLLIRQEVHVGPNGVESL